MGVKRPGSTPGGARATRDPPSRSRTVAASARLTATTRSDSRPSIASPASRPGDSGRSPADSSVPGSAAIEWKVCTWGTPHSRATGSAAAPENQWWEWTTSGICSVRSRSPKGVMSSSCSPLGMRRAGPTSSRTTRTPGTGWLSASASAPDLRVTTSTSCPAAAMASAV